MSKQLLAAENKFNDATANLNKLVKEAASKGDDFQRAVDTAKELSKVGEQVKDAQKVLDTSISAARGVGLSGDVVNGVSKITAKGIGFAPVAGVVLDAASLGFSIAGLTQSLQAKEKDAGLIALNATSTLADTVGLVGSGMALAGAVMSTTGVGLPIGASLMGIGSVISLIAGGSQLVWVL